MIISPEITGLYEFGAILGVYELYNLTYLNAIFRKMQFNVIFGQLSAFFSKQNFFFWWGGRGSGGIDSVELRFRPVCHASQGTEWYYRPKGLSSVLLNSV